MAYRVLADRLGVDQKVVRKLGEKGLLGPDSIRLFISDAGGTGQGSTKGRNEFLEWPDGHDG